MSQFPSCCWDKTLWPKAILGPGEERVYFILHFQVTVYHCGDLKAGIFAIPQGYLLPGNSLTRKVPQKLWRIATC